MKKSFKDIYNVLQKRRKKIKFRSILLLVFLFGVNAYAWFVYMSNASVNLSSTVSSWNVSFLDGGEESKDLTIDTGNIYPGMDTFLKEFLIKNKSDTKASFEYKIENLNIFGEKIEDDDLELFLKEKLPFTLEIIPSKKELDKNDTVILDIKLDWPYESLEKYYKVIPLLEYQENFTYYTKTSDIYKPAVINKTSYLDMVSEGLYLESDDADTYFGSKCDEYKTTTGSKSCLNFHIKLTVIQK